MNAHIYAVPSVSFTLLRQREEEWPVDATALHFTAAPSSALAPLSSLVLWRAPAAAAILR